LKQNFVGKEFLKDALMKELITNFWEKDAGLEILGNLTEQR